MNPRGRPLFKKQLMNKRKASHSDWLYGADDRIRTGDLILTKDALYRLSYISTSFDARFIIQHTAEKCKRNRRLILNLSLHHENYLVWNDNIMAAA